MRNDFFSRPSVDRNIFHNYPKCIRDAYQSVVREQNSTTRHKKLMFLIEQIIKFISSLAFSDYRSQNFLSPHIKVEDCVCKLPKKMSLGHYIQLFRTSVEVPGLSVFDEKTLSHTDDLNNMRNFHLAIRGVEDAIKLGASNLQVVIEMAMEKKIKHVKWASCWELLVEYRNKSEGHPKEHNWPVDNAKYFSLMAPALEKAILDLLSSSYFHNIIQNFPIGRIVNVERHAKTYLHTIQTEDEGIPIDIRIEMDRPISDIWGVEGWQANTDSEIILKKTGDGGYTIHALFAQLGDGTPLNALEIKSAKGPLIQSAPVHTASEVPWSRGVGKAVGTCGELAQGFLPCGEPFHVTAPIAKSSTVTVRLRPAKEYKFEGFQRCHNKMKIACRRALEMLSSEPVELIFDHWSDLDVGKGMGSSTADIIAASRAISSALGKTFSEEELALLATGIESSDGTMHVGVNAVNHKKGNVLHHFKWWPDYTIVICIPENSFNTESANFSGKEKLGDEFEKILEELKAASEEKDARRFGKACSLSANLNQRFLPNPIFNRISRRFDDLKADGICLGHTGTVVGVLFAGVDGPERASDAMFELQEMLPRVRVELTKLVSGEM